MKENIKKKVIEFAAHFERSHPEICFTVNVDILRELIRSYLEKNSIDG